MKLLAVPKYSFVELVAPLAVAVGVAAASVLVAPVQLLAKCPTAKGCNL